MHVTDLLPELRVQGGRGGGPSTRMGATGDRRTATSKPHGLCHEPRRRPGSESCGEGDRDEPAAGPYAGSGAGRLSPGEQRSQPSTRAPRPRRRRKRRLGKATPPSINSETNVSRQAVSSPPSPAPGRNRAYPFPPTPSSTRPPHRVHNGVMITCTWHGSHLEAQGAGRETPRTNEAPTNADILVTTLSAHDEVTLVTGSGSLGEGESWTGCPNSGKCGQTLPASPDLPAAPPAVP